MNDIHWVLLCVSGSRTEIFKSLKYAKITFETDLRHLPFERELFQSIVIRVYSSVQTPFPRASGFCDNF